MGGSTPTHTYCSLRDLLKNQPPLKPKFKNHSCLRTKPELEDVFTNMSIDVKLLESLSPSKKPSYQIINDGSGNGKMRAYEKPKRVEPSIGCIFNHEKSKPRCVEEKKIIDSQVDMFASDEDEKLKVSFAKGAKEDAEKKDMEKKDAVQPEELEKNSVMESEKQGGEEKEEIKFEE